VLVVDDHKIMRQGLICVLAEDPVFVVVGEAENGEEAVRQDQALHPDVIVMDVDMPVLDGIEATRQIKRQRPESNVIALSLHGAEMVSKAMAAAGAAEYVSKNSPSEELFAAIRRACGRD